MTPKIASKQDTRTALLQAGTEIMMEKGYTNTGIQEVLTSLGVPKGSFYHYFESKENFAVAIIEYFDQGYSANLLRTLRNPAETPIQRLYTYCDQIKQQFLEQDCRKGCLVGNLSQEMSDQSEILRKHLMTVMMKWRDIVAACIEEGQSAGEITPEIPAEKLAELFSSSWGGAVMRAKTMKTTEPMDVFIDIWFGQFLKP